MILVEVAMCLLEVLEVELGKELEKLAGLVVEVCVLDQQVLFLVV
jgi:hypothetical protein